MSNISKEVFLSLLPPGSIWTIAEGKDFDKLLDGISENSELIRLFLDLLADIRNPFKTPILNDLEREFGILPDERIDEETRRKNLATNIFSKNGTGSDDNMEKSLRDAGFDVFVHENSPAIDPAIFLDQIFQMVAGGDKAFAGNADAFASRLGGELVVNGDMFIQTEIYTMIAGGDFAFAGNQDAMLGRFDEYNIDKIEFDIPTDPKKWPFIFFVGGVATRDPITDALTEILSAEVESERRSELLRIILKFKPLHSWAGLVIIFT